jgi:hypothetical protein
MDEHSPRRVRSRLLQVLRRIDDVLVLGGSACCVSRSYRDLDVVRRRDAGAAVVDEAATSSDRHPDAGRPAPA